ncbi:hypothetical protein DU002_17140 [Corallincola holothuriorum]|uniref:NodB homology domain-containing protein n=1 Tax=Corallincola holothuriorum TaxID=2282215 RepID=A0A368N545_9GAMM|nr:polysaccharide deacetylase family protein [Corallincola holothuriorum]RCU45153.1 hypothetical protein DU002_17140 [Corallincola holothuriorum]
MLGQLKRSKSRIVRFTAELGGYQLARLLTKRQPRILMYHRFSDTPKHGFVDLVTLRQQLSILKRDFNVVSLGQLVQSLNGGAPLPEHAIVLTVDDGYDDFYQYAYPEFKALGIPVSFFVTTGFVDGKTWLWPDMLTDLLKNIDIETAHWPQHTPQKITKNIAQTKDRKSTRKILNSYLMPLNLSTKLAWLREAADLNAYHIAASAPDNYAPVSWDGLREMAESGIVDIGAHTVMHPTLSGELPSRALEEINQSKARLEVELGACVPHFCYPNGQPEDFNNETIKMVKASEFGCAVSAHCEYVTLHDLYALPRFAATTNPFHFKKIVYGVQWLSRRISQHRYFKQLKAI